MHSLILPSRLLVSQDFNEVFITIAEFDDLYVKYIKGDNNIDWLRGSDEASPSRGSRPTGEAGQGRPPTDKTPEKENKTGTRAFGALKKKAPDSPPGPSASTQLPFRNRTAPAPVTPSKPGATKPETPQAPKQGTPTVKNVDLESKGFLRMHQFRAFRLKDPAHVYELALLLYSLTDYLTGSDAAQTLQFERSAHGRSRGSK